MGYDVEKAKYYVEKYYKLANEYNELIGNNKDLPKTKEQYIMEIKKYDESLAYTKNIIDNLDKSHILYDEIFKFYDVLYQNELEYFEKLRKAMNMLDLLKELEKIIIIDFEKPIIKEEKAEKQKFPKIEYENELEIFLNNACLKLYGTNLNCILVTGRTNELIEYLKEAGTPDDTIKVIKVLISKKKSIISENLTLSDKALIDLIEHTTCKNITEQQRHNEKESSGFNKPFEGKVIIENKDEYILLNNQVNYGVSTKGEKIKRFSEQIESDEQNEQVQFNRKDSDMLSQNFTRDVDVIETYRSFISLPDDKKKEFIRKILSNLELCYNLFKDYYSSNSVEVPTKILLTNGTEMLFNYQMNMSNLPHILGIPTTNKFDPEAKRYSGQLNLPSETLSLLGLRNRNALGVLEGILANKDKIIDNFGLNYDANTKTYYEMLPWERILLKTNAFIRGDFFGKTAYVTDVNPNSYLLHPDDNITKISITPTYFNESIFDLDNITSRRKGHSLKEFFTTECCKTDFLFKGMSFNEDKGIWYPKTNASAMGERICISNKSRIRTLEKYRYLFSQDIPPSKGGFILAIESPALDNYVKVYTREEIENCYSEILFAFVIPQDESTINEIRRRDGHLYGRHLIYPRKRLGRFSDIKNNLGERRVILKDDIISPTASEKLKKLTNPNENKNQ